MWQLHLYRGIEVWQLRFKEVTNVVAAFQDSFDKVLICEASPKFGDFASRKKSTFLSLQPLKIKNYCTSVIPHLSIGRARSKEGKNNKISKEQGIDKKREYGKKKIGHEIKSCPRPN